VCPYTAGEARPTEALVDLVHLRRLVAELHGSSERLAPPRRDSLSQLTAARPAAQQMAAEPVEHAMGLQPLTVLHNSLLPRPGQGHQLAVLTNAHAVQLVSWEGGLASPRRSARLAYGSEDAVCCAAWCDPCARCRTGHLQA